MSEKKTIREIIEHKDKMLSIFNQYLTKELNRKPKKVDLISYWIKDYCKYLDFEGSFSPKKLPKYKRGDVIKVNFGFRVGSELGGLHLAVVLDAKNSSHSDTITVVPLKSYKGKCNNGDLYIGSSIYKQICKKLNEKAEKALENTDDSDKQNKDIEFLKLAKEFEGFKEGSVVSLTQICTISKMRIYQPKNTDDTLYGVRIPKEIQISIDKNIMERYFPINMG